MRWFIFSILFLVFTSFAGTEGKKLSWKPGRVLTWEDFQGTPDKANDHHAQTHCMLDASILSNGNEVQFLIHAYFLPQQSWTRTTKDLDLLLHEQLHFDIAELHARKLRKRLVTLFRKDADLELLFDQVFETVNQEMKMMQDRYDKETYHGTKKAKQRVWNEKVRQELQSLEKYATPDHTIALQ